MRLGHREPRPEDDVGRAREERSEQEAVFGRVVLEVRVLHDDVVGGGFGEPASEGSSLPLVERLGQHANPRIGDRPGEGRRPVGRGVVDDDELAREGRRQSTRLATSMIVAASL